VADFEKWRVVRSENEKSRKRKRVEIYENETEGSRDLCRLERVGDRGAVKNLASNTKFLLERMRTSFKTSTTTLFEISLSFCESNRKRW
jgi:hypothetical protein